MQSAALRFERLRTSPVSRNALSCIARFRLGSGAFVHENLATLRFERLRTRQVFRNTLTGIARFRLGSAAFVHENLAALRFSVSLWFYIYYNYSRV